MPQRFIWFNNKIDNCVEQVKMGNGFVQRVTNPELKGLIIKYAQNCINMPKARPDKFPGSLPVSIFRSQLPILLQGKHLHAPKTKGTRYRLIALKLCSEIAFVDDESTNKAQKEELKSRSETEIAMLAAAPPSEETISLTGTRKKYNKKKKTNTKIVEEDETDEKGHAPNALEQSMIVAELKQRLAQRVQLIDNENSSDEDDENDSDDEDETGSDLVAEFSTNLAPVEGATLNSNQNNNNGNSTTLKQNEKLIKAVQYIIALIDRSNEIYLLPNIQLAESVYPAFLDGELALHRETNEWHFLVFNLSVSNGYPYKHWKYEERIAEYFQFVKLFSIFTQSVDDIPPISKIIAKPQRQWYEFDLVYEEYKNGAYDSDGILSTRNKTSAVEYGTDYESYKTKPLAEHTSDLIAGADPQDPFKSNKIYLLQAGYCNAQDDLCDVDNLYPECEMDVYRFFNDRQKFPLDWIENRDNWNGKVIESLLDLKTNEYHAIHVRTDKKHPNTAKVIKYTRQNLIEAVTPEELFELWQQWKQDQSVFRPLPKNTMMEIHQSTEQDHNFLRNLFQETNWKPQMITPNKMGQYITALKLSWEYKTEQEELAEQTAPYPVSDYSTAIISIDKAELKRMLDVENLKPIVKNKRKGRKRMATSMNDETESVSTVKLHKKLKEQQQQQDDSNFIEESIDESASVANEDETEKEDTNESVSETEVHNISESQDVENDFSDDGDDEEDEDDDENESDEDGEEEENEDEDMEEVDDDQSEA